MLTRKLVWEPKGYQVEGYEWWNYTINTNVYSLRHDCFHHQLGESGTDWEEFRAFGARLWFEADHNMYVVVRRYVSILRNLPVPDNYNKIFEPVITTVYYNYAMQRVLRDVAWEYWCSILNDGYKYAKQFSEKAYRKFLEIDFEEQHSLGKNLEIDLKTGKIIKIWDK